MSDITQRNCDQNKTNQCEQANQAAANDDKLKSWTQFIRLSPKLDATKPGASPSAASSEMRRPKRRAPLEGRQQSPLVSSHSPQSAHPKATSSARKFVCYHRAHHLVRLCPLALITLSLMISWLSGRHQQLASCLMLASDCLTSGGAANCQCSWKSGKFVADCSTLNLTKVPKNDYFDHLLESSGGENRMSTLNRDIQALNLSSNHIGHLSSMEFAQKKFRNLQRIQLNNNKLRYIEFGAFYKLTGLIELDLSDNQLEQLETVSANNSTGRSLELSGGASTPISSNQSKKNDTLAGPKHDPSGSRSFLQDLVQVRHLNMNSNGLKRIGSFAFSPMVQLRQLYLSRNHLKFIDKRAFDGLNELNILHLDGNKLTHLNGEILLRLPQLHALQLAGPENKWRCDCHLRKLVRLLLHKPGARGASNSTILQDEPRCHHLAWSTRETDQPTRLRRRRRQTNGLNDRTSRRPNSLDNAKSERSSETTPTTLTTATTTTTMMGGESIRSAGSIVGNSLANGQRQVAKNQLEATEATAKHPTTMSNFPMDSAQWGRVRPQARPQQVSRAEREALVSGDQDDDHQDRHGRLWTSLALGDFECAPQLASAYLEAKVEFEDKTKFDETTNNGLDDDNWPAPVGRNGDQLGDGGAKSGAQRKQQPPPPIESITLERERVKANGPIELTCPIGLVDELDVSLTRVEWLLQLQQPARGDHKHQLAKLIWRSSNDNNGNGNQSDQLGQQSEVRHSDGDDLDKQRPMIMMKLESATSGPMSGRRRANGMSTSDAADDHDDEDDEFHDGLQKQRLRVGGKSAISYGDKFAIIDYVTRANASQMAKDELEDADAGQLGQKAASWNNANGLGPEHSGGGGGGSRLIRLVHLIVEPKATVRSKLIWFLCRVSNSAGQLNVWQPIELLVDDQFDASGAHSNDSLAKWRLHEMARENLANVGNQLEQLLLESGTNSPKSPAASGQGARLGSNERVRLQLEQEFASLEMGLNSKGTKQALFLPLSVTPRRLLMSLSSARPKQSSSANGSNQMVALMANSLERSLIARPDSSSSVRPNKLRQTNQLNNITNAPAGQETRETASRNRNREVGPTTKMPPRAFDELTMGTNENDDHDKEQASQRSTWVDANRDHLDSLQEVALGLIGRFTSGQRSLIADWKSVDSIGAELEERPRGERRTFQLGLESRFGQATLGQLLAEAWRRPDRSVVAKLGEFYQIFSLKLVEVRRSSLFAMLPHLMAALLAGCLLTLAILFKLNACRRRQDKSQQPLGALDKSASGSDCDRSRGQRDEFGGGVGGGKLANVKLRCKIAAAECSAKVMKCKSNSALPLGIDGRRRRRRRLCIKSNERDEPNESDGPSDYANDGHDQERESSDGLHSYYSNSERAEPSTSPSQTLLQMSCRTDNHQLDRQHQCTTITTTPHNNQDDQRDEQFATSADNAHNRPPGPSGSTNSTTTITNGSQRILVANGQNGTLLRDCAGQKGVVNLFSSLPRGVSTMMHKSSTVENFIVQDNYERLMGSNHRQRNAGANCSPSRPSTATSELMSESNSANHQLEASLGLWCPRNQIDNNKSSTLQRSNQRARFSARQNNQQSQVLTAASGGNNKRTVTWLMSSESIQNGQELAADQLERSTGLRRMNLSNYFSRPNCSANDNNKCNGQVPNWTSELIAARHKQQLDSQQGVQQSCCWSAQSSAMLAPESGSLFALTGVTGEAQLGSSSIAPNNSARLQSFLIADPIGGKKLEFLDNGGEICLLPACLCANNNNNNNNNNNGHDNNQEANNELVLDSDESYHLYGMFSACPNSDQSCCNRLPTASTSTTTSTLGTTTNTTGRPLAELAHESSQHHFRQAASSSSIASPNATISTSSASTGYFTGQPSQRQRRRRLSRTDAEYNSDKPTANFGQLDEALTLLQNSLDQCERVRFDSTNTNGLYR